MDKLKENLLWVVIGGWALAGVVTWFFFVRGNQKIVADQTRALSASCGVLKGYHRSGAIPSDAEIEGYRRYKADLFGERGASGAVQFFTEKTAQLRSPFDNDPKVFDEFTRFFSLYRTGLTQLAAITEGMLKERAAGRALPGQRAKPVWTEPDAPPASRGEAERWQAIFWIQNEIALILRSLRDQAPEHSRRNFELDFIEFTKGYRTDPSRYFRTIPWRAVFTVPAEAVTQVQRELLSPRRDAVAMPPTVRPEFAVRRNLFFSIVDFRVIKNNDLRRRDTATPLTPGEIIEEDRDPDRLVPGVVIDLVAEAYDFFPAARLTGDPASVMFNRDFATMYKEQTTGGILPVAAPAPAPAPA
ncbi:MAG: hypothetical protein HY719_15290, partial [Planctomycetes bacterium]|nr:hypothetical protein [Planctomycetota bacterium]